MEGEFNTLNSEKTVKPKKHGCLLAILILIGFIVVVWGLRKISIGLFLIAERGRMEAHLEEKYGKEFRVRDIEYFGPSAKAFGDSAYVLAHVDPSDYKNLKFPIQRLLKSDIRRLDDFVNDYGDSYLHWLWDKQAESEVEELLQSVLGFVPERWIPPISEEDRYSRIPYFISDAKPSDKLSEKIYGSMLNYEEAKMQYSGEIEFSLMIVLYESNDINEHTERVFQIVQFMQANKLDKSDIIYDARNANNVRFYCSLDAAKIKEINTAQDVLNHFSTESLLGGY